MRKYKILVLTNNISEAHETVLKNTFGKRPYAGVTSRVNEMILKYDDAEITIKRCEGDNLNSMRGYRWDEVWIDEYVYGNLSEQGKESLLVNIFYRTGLYKKQISKMFPHYANRTAINYFKKWE